MTSSQVISTHEMVEGLHARFTGLEGRLSQLHGDHKELRSEVSELSTALREVESRVTTHEGIAAEKLRWLTSLVESLERKFDHHTLTEMENQRWVSRLLIMTFLSAAGGLITMMFKITGVF